MFSIYYMLFSSLQLYIYVLLIAVSNLLNRFYIHPPICLPTSLTSSDMPVLYKHIFHLL
jgi:hypothetical protein